MRTDLIFRSVTAIALSVICLTAAAAAQSGGLKGKVRANSGSGIPNAVVTAVRDGREVRSTRSAKDGSFELKGLNDGFYSLRVEADGYSTGTRQGIEVKSKVRDLGDQMFLRIDRGTQVIVNGSVFYREGTSLPGAKLEIEKVEADGGTRKISNIESGPTGEFSFTQPPGAARFRITATHKGAAATKEISVDNAAVYRIALTLDLPTPKN